MEAPYLSTQTIVEKCPDAAPDELERIINERGSLVSRNDKVLEQNADKANNIAKNRSNDIVDNMRRQPVIDYIPPTVNS